MKKLVFIAYCLFFIMLISCNKNKITQGNHEEHEHWSYEGETSPERWAELEKNSDCSGKKQSPINIIDLNTVEDTLTYNRLKLLYCCNKKIFPQYRFFLSLL